MTEKSQDKTPVEESDREAFVIGDPEEYQKKKKLQSIYKRRERILKLSEDRTKLVEEYGSTYRETGKDIWKGEYATACAEYGNELLPLITDAIEKGELDGSLMHMDEGNIDIYHFIVSQGKRHTGDDLETPEPFVVMNIYRRLDNIMRELGLGLNLEEQKGPAEI
jgi:hypothetical protein